jgi:hypothetical protein
MPNMAAQLVIDPLFRCGVLFFRGGVRGDVLRHFFSPKEMDCEWKQETDSKKTHSRMVRFFGGVMSSVMGCFPLSAMALGFLL